MTAAEQAYPLHGGKAKGLLRIQGIESINVPEFTVIPADSTEQEQLRVIRDFTRTHKGAFEKVAVRSSALQEDGLEKSFAGAFDTLLNVPLKIHDIQKAASAIRYDGEDKLRDIFNTKATNAMAVVVQAMVENPDYAGVCLSQGYTKEDAGYLLVNFRKGLGDKLVGGLDGGVELRVLRNGGFKHATVQKYPFLPDLVEAVNKIGKQFKGQPVDIEFAVKNNVLYILQARPFLVDNRISTLEEENVTRSVARAQAYVDQIDNSDILCDMSDINPRELLGDVVHPVNLSLFREMFADTIVEQVRHELGYNPLYVGLVQEIHGKPYVSLRASAYSIRPQGISDATYEKMVQIYVGKVKENQDLQDRVEFSVFITSEDQLPAFFKVWGKCFTGKEQGEIEEAFGNLGKKLEVGVSEFSESYSQTLQDYKDKVNSLSEEDSLQSAMGALTEGTKLFVKTARLAFYKKALCEQRYGEEQVRNLLVSMDTPSEKMQKDLLLYAKGEIDEEILAEEYGHIRPGQMNIFSSAYRDDLVKNLDLRSYADMSFEEASKLEEDFVSRKRNIEDKLEALPDVQEKDVKVLRLLLKAREEVKHEFMRAYDVVASKLNGQINLEQVDTNILLPDVISSDIDLSCLRKSSKYGTYFTKEKVQAMPLVVTDKNLSSITKEDVEGKILIMDHADPGYDFLLLYKPSGIITKIGGPASHIAIRVNEYGIPANIGCGIDLTTVDETKEYVLDCNSQKHYATASKEDGLGYDTCTP